MQCLNCGKSIPDIKVYCNEVCRFAFLAKNGGDPPIFHRVCKLCGKPFITSKHTQRFCSAKCRFDSFDSKRKKIFKKICPVCGKNFNTTYPSQKYCSDECRLSAKREMRRAFYHTNKDNKPTPAPKKEKPSKSKYESAFDKVIREADECGLSYGQYKAQLKFGKTYEELKADYERRRNLD